jgi:hypothetical protein
VVIICQIDQATNIAGWSAPFLQEAQSNNGAGDPYYPYFDPDSGASTCFSTMSNCQKPEGAIPFAAKLPRQFPLFSMR